MSNSFNKINLLNKEKKLNRLRFALLDKIESESLYKRISNQKRSEYKKFYSLMS